MADRPLSAPLLPEFGNGEASINSNRFYDLTMGIVRSLFNRERLQVKSSEKALKEVRFIKFSG